MQLLKKKLLITVATVLLFGSNVKAETDCEYLERALKYLNDDVKNAFKIDKCCDFNGVRCDANKNIVELRFNNVKQTKDVKGFVDRIANIKNLHYLDLAHDNIEGEIPKSLCTITSLKNLNLAKNKLKGTIPYDCKNLQNLEQFNLEGNPDLTGYVPVLPNLKGCAFKDSGLCDVQNSLCKNSPKICTEEDIKNTNAKNGNPDSNSTAYEGSETRSRDSSIYANDQGYSYGYTGYDDSSVNSGTSYDTSNYYGQNSYGYGDWGYGSGYDNSYYNNGYYGQAYDNSGYGYSSNYGTSYYDDSNYGYGVASSGNGATYGDGSGDGGFFTSLFSIVMYCILFAILLFICCTCCFCKNCCAGDIRTAGGRPTQGRPGFGGVKETTIKVDNEPNPYLANNNTTTTTTTQYGYGRREVPSEMVVKTEEKAVKKTLEE